MPLPCSTLRCRLLLHPARGAEQSLEGTTAGPWGVPISPSPMKSYTSVAQTAHVLECIAPTTHPQLPVAILGHLPGAGHPQKLLLGVQTPPGVWRLCFGRLLVQRRGALAGSTSSGAIYFTSHQICSPGKRRHAVTADALCSPFGATHTQGWAEKPQQWLPSVRSVMGMRVTFWGPPRCSPRTCSPQDLTFTVSKTCTNL